MRPRLSPHVHLVPHASSVDGIQRAARTLVGGEAEHFGAVPLVLLGAKGDAWEAWRRVAWPVHEPRLAASRSVVGLAGVQHRHGRQAPAARVVVAHRADLATQGAGLAMRWGARFALHAHNAPPPWLRWGDVRRAPWTRRTDVVIVASADMATAWEPVAGDLVREVPLPIDLEQFEMPAERERAEAKQRLGLAPDRPWVGFIGRLEPDKGLDVLAEAVARLDARGRPVGMLVQGRANLDVPPDASSAYETRWKRAAGEVPVVQLASTPQTRDFYAAADLVVVPSVWREPSGLVASEALASGSPVIVSDIGGLPEQLPDSPWAVATAPGDPVALAETIGRLLDQDTPGADARGALRAHVARERSVAPVVERYVTALRGSR